MIKFVHLQVNVPELPSYSPLVGYQAAGGYAVQRAHRTLLTFAPRLVLYSHLQVAILRWGLTGPLHYQMLINHNMPWVFPSLLLEYAMLYALKSLPASTSMINR